MAAASTPEVKTTPATAEDKKSSRALQFYGCDLCPFAHRSWIAILEKEADPAKPVLFDYHHIPLHNKPAILKTINPGETVPSGTHNGNNLYESLLFNEYIDEVFPERPLLPATAGGRFRARLLIEKHVYLMQGYYQYLSKYDPEEQPAILAKVLAAYEKFNDDIVGPYVLGEQFSLVDAAYFPFVERTFLVVGKWRGFVLPDEPRFAKVHAWYRAVSARPAVAITIAPRVGDSLLGPYEAKDRAGYLSEVYEGYAFGQIDYVRALLPTAKPGVRAYALEELKIRADADLARKRGAAAAVARPAA